MPEIAEAQALLAALAETDEVKFAADSRRQRVHLQTSYGKALIGVHGYGAPETALAFERARELATGLQAAGLGRSPSIAFRPLMASGSEPTCAASFFRCVNSPRRSCAKARGGQIREKRALGIESWGRRIGSRRNSLRRALISSKQLRYSTRRETRISPSATGKTSAYLHRAIPPSPYGHLAKSTFPGGARMMQSHAPGPAVTLRPPLMGLALSGVYRLLIRDPEGAQPIAAQLGKAAEDLQSPQYLAFYDILGGWPAWRSGSGEFNALADSSRHRAVKGSRHENMGSPH